MSCTLYLRINWIKPPWTFCKSSFVLLRIFNVKVKLCLTFCIDQFMVNTKFV
ncbi:hypothetical protein HanRHA438_Chr06g0271671 [Helianthus annuus]|nr:hypothetical protein HanRHA438_Chr06g0271671 [Helianthus annuus]